MVLQQEKALMREGYDIGMGVAMATGSPMAKGATGEITPPDVGSGGSGTFTFRRIDTTEELSTELGIGADVSSGIGLFSASASFDFTKKCKIQSSSLCVVISATKAFAFKQMDAPALTQAAANLVETNPARFSEQFGEYFVRGIRTGGRFFGVVRIDTKSAQSKTDVDIALSGSYGATVDADVKVKISNALSTANARAEVFILNEGGNIRTFPTSQDPLMMISQLYTAMDEWNASVQDLAMPYGVTLAPYSLALGPLPPNIAELEHQRDVLMRCAKLRSLTLDKLNLVDYVLDPDHTAEFQITPPPDGPDLPALQSLLAGDLEVISDTASFAINNVKKACFPEVFMKEIRGVPNFKLTALPTDMPLHGGPKITVPVLPANAMPNLVGQLAEPVVRLLACVNLEPVDHCLGFLGNSLDGLGLDPRTLGNFFFVVLRSGVTPDVRGDSSRPGARIKAQFPPPGAPVEPLTVMTLEIT